MVSELSVAEILRVRDRLASMDIASLDFGARVPLYPDRLESAVARQVVGFGGVRKYQRVHEIAATLFFGLVTAHAFDNGNKRTGLVSTLVFFAKNGVLLDGHVTEDDLYLLATDTADWKSSSRWRERSPDAIVSELGWWFKSHLIATKVGYRAMRTRDFLEALRALGCEVGPPDKSFVRVTPPPGNREGRVTKVAYRDEGREVPARYIRAIRRKLGLTPEHGVFETEFFDLEPAVDEFVVMHAEVLSRLADT